MPWKWFHYLLWAEDSSFEDDAIVNVWKVYILIKKALLNTKW